MWAWRSDTTARPRPEAGPRAGGARDRSRAVLGWSKRQVRRRPATRFRPGAAGRRNGVLGRGPRGELLEGTCPGRSAAAGCSARRSARAIAGGAIEAGRRDMSRRLQRRGGRGPGRRGGRASADGLRLARESPTSFGGVVAGRRDRSEAGAGRGAGVGHRENVRRDRSSRRIGDRRRGPTQRVIAIAGVGFTGPRASARALGLTPREAACIPKSMLRRATTATTTTTLPGGVGRVRVR